MRMTYTRCFLGFLLLALVLGCGDGMAPPANISVSVAPTTASLLTGVSQDFTAMVANERGAKGVTWSITGCTGGPPVCGALSNVTSTAATYTAPAPILSDAQLGITARSVTDNTKAFTATVAITAIAVNGQIAFLSNREGYYEIYAINADGSGQVDLTNNPATDWEIAWSPDGSKIAFTSSRDRNWEIYVMNADGSGQVNLTNNSAPDYLPAWSPDGQKIAFASERDGNGEIYVMNADGSGLVNLTDNPAVDNAGAAWSPDGSKIVFYTNRDGNYEIYAVNVDGSGSTRLTNDPAYDVSPAWSPDGSHIAFESTRGGIYVMNADGSAVVGLTTGGSLTSPPYPPLRPL